MSGDFASELLHAQLCVSAMEKNNTCILKNSAFVWETVQFWVSCTSQVTEWEY